MLSVTSQTHKNILHKVLEKPKLWIQTSDYGFLGQELVKTTKKQEKTF